jgi:hypothetical protein
MDITVIFSRMKHDPGMAGTGYLQICKKNKGKLNIQWIVFIINAFDGSHFKC